MAQVDEQEKLVKSLEHWCFYLDSSQEQGGKVFQIISLATSPTAQLVQHLRIKQRGYTH